MAYATGVAALAPNVEVCTSTKEWELGNILEGPNGKRYRYVQFKDAVAYKAGDVVTAATGGNPYVVTKDRSGGSALAGLFPVGVVFQETVPTENQYGWVQIAGVAAVVAGASITAGDVLKPDASEDGDVDGAAISTTGYNANIVGVALANIADNATGNVLLTIPGI